MKLKEKVVKFADQAIEGEYPASLVPRLHPGHTVSLTGRNSC